MLDGIKRAIIAWLAPTLWVEVTTLRGLLALADKKVADLKDDLAKVEDERNHLLDRLLQANGQPMMYTQEVEKPIVTNNRPLQGITRGGDWARMATVLENEATENVGFHR